MLRLLSTGSLFFLASILFAQDISKRVIVIGDAGEINKGQESVIAEAQKLIIPNKTIAFYLGDNIYPNGMGLSGIEKDEGERSLRSQYEPFRTKGVPVYFMAGNHDWNVSKPGGLEKLVAQDRFLKVQSDDLLKLLPEAGTPGPVSVPLAEDFVAIIYDSEYWLYPYHEGDEISPEKRKQFLESLSELVDANRDKRVIMLSHHPMSSFGEHGLSFGLKQHLFPLTRINKKLYIPLPIVGSLYPLWRGFLFNSAEDLPHKTYKKLINDVLSITKGHPNILYVAGHDHGLQYIEKEWGAQVVSGSASKSSYIRNHPDLKFKYEHQGFCVLDYLTDGTLLASYYVWENNTSKKAFEKKIIKK